MKHDKVLYALIALFLMIGGALVTKPMWLPQTEEAKPEAIPEDVMDVLPPEGLPGEISFTGFQNP